MSYRSQEIIEFSLQVGERWTRQMRETWHYRALPWLAGTLALPCVPLLVWLCFRLHLRLHFFGHPAVLIAPSALLFTLVREGYQKRLEKKLNSVTARVVVTSPTHARILVNGKAIAEGPMELVRYAGSAQGGVKPLTAGLRIQDTVLTCGLDIPVPGLGDAPLVEFEEFIVTPQEFGSSVPEQSARGTS
jgi:hypothetical protein